MDIPCGVLAVFFLLIFRMTVESSTIKADELAKKKEEEVRKNAAAQLDRLKYFQKTKVPDTPPPAAESRHFLKSEKNVSADPKNATTEFTVPVELLHILRKHFHEGNTLESLSKKRIDEVLPDSAYNAIMVERIKRGSSGSFLSGIASKLVGGIASASASSSGSSSSTSYTAPVQSYGPPQTFDIWDFKKAVLNTLLQAVKAISGSVIALKGQIVKGGGFLISTKGKIISSAGEAITSLGRNIASSALVAKPKPQPSYSYPPTDHYDSHYDGKPPNSDELSSEFSPPSGHFPSRPNIDESSEEDDESNPGHDVEEFDVHTPNLAALEESFGGPQKGITLAGLLSSSIEPPRQESSHNIGSESFHAANSAKPGDFHNHLFTKNPFSQENSVLRDSTKNLLNHIIQETNLNYQSLNKLQYPNNDHLHGSSTFSSYGRVQPTAAAGYNPHNIQQPDSNIQPPQLPLLPHLNPEELPKIQSGLVQYGKPWYPTGNAHQEPLKVPLFQADQPPNGHNNWQNTQPQQYPTGGNSFNHGSNGFRNPLSSPSFDIQASVDISPGEFRDGKFHRI